MLRFLEKSHETEKERKKEKRKKEGVFTLMRERERLNG